MSLKLPNGNYIKALGVMPALNGAVVSYANFSALVFKDEAQRHRWPDALDPFEVYKQVAYTSVELDAAIKAEIAAGATSISDVITKLCYAALKALPEYADAIDA